MEARPKSGYFVHTQRAQAELPASGGAGAAAGGHFAMGAGAGAGAQPAARGPDPAGARHAGYRRADDETADRRPAQRRHGDLRSLYYDSIQGVAALREQVARLLLDSGCQIGPDQLLITTGCRKRFPPGCAPFANPATSWRSTRPASTAPCRR